MPANRLIGARRALLRAALGLCAVAVAPVSADAPESAAGRRAGRRDGMPHVRRATAAANAVSAAAWNRGSLGTIDPSVFQLALGAAACAVRSGSVGDPPTLTVIDYSRPSSDKRLWVFDLVSRELLYEELVAHGQGSGGNMATLFSNEPETHRTSIGLFVTADTYVGKNGYSLRLDGLDRGFNDRARERAIVMHGAPYVSEAFVSAQGRLGRSWGCPAVSDAVAREVIDRVKGGGLIFAYYPDEQWLRASAFLGSCSLDQSQ